MRLRHLFISNFRGIQQLDWEVTSLTVCLVGPNNATKTTILTAIEYALSPRWNLSFYDSDFYQSNTEKPIRIVATVAGLPSSLVDIDKFGLYLQGWNPEQGLNSQDLSTFALSIELLVDSSLEPRWNVVTENNDPKPISARERAQIGVARVGNYVDRDLAWGRNSVLTRFSDIQNLNLAEINRAARQAISEKAIDELLTASTRVKHEVAQLGVSPIDDFRPAFDAETVSISAGTLSLHDGNVPVRLYGLGSKRLISLAIQKSITREGSILLIDEIETALEPYRLRQLLRSIRGSEILVQEGGELSISSQTIMTTHSTITLIELRADELFIVRSHQGRTTVQQIGSGEDFQKLVRAVPEALLSPRVIVCEGATEYGILRAMDNLWSRDHDGMGMAYCGVELADGKGSTASERAIKLTDLGYEVLYFADSDVDVDPEMKQGETTIVCWAGAMNTEHRIMKDVPREAVLRLIELAVEIWGEQKVFADLNNVMPGQDINVSVIQETLDMGGSTETQMRDAIALAASRKGWFKRIDLGMRVGDVLVDVFHLIETSEVYKQLNEIENWIYDNE